ncbi:unknown_gene_3341 [Phodopus roborovskii]|uniref:Unknown_gene_3341 protein n=1 Tax=Phodopus roborovskii TaxID=109678 RepID=A0AAU9ZU06_PHORO|nr:unknown_gene_3341 [Phodopus roborovskii]
MVFLSLWLIAASLVEVRTSADGQVNLPIKRYREYELVTPVSTNLKGHYLSHILSANHKKRSPRDVSFNSEQLFFNITAFGRDFHLRLKPNTHFIAPGAVVEWHETSPRPGNTTDPGNSAAEKVWRSEPLQTSCAYVGDIMDIPGTSVAISNCDGLVRLISFPMCVHMGVCRCWQSVVCPPPLPYNCYSLCILPCESYNLLGFLSLVTAGA